MHNQKRVVAVAASVLSLATGGGVAWACTGPGGDPGGYTGTTGTGTTSTTTATTTPTTTTSTTTTSASTRHSKRVHTRRHNRRS